jgi:Zn finger protein HypA/HybF involved in hydrogenase expression
MKLDCERKILYSENCRTYKWLNYPLVGYKWKGRFLYNRKINIRDVFNILLTLGTRWWYTLHSFRLCFNVWLDTILTHTVMYGCIMLLCTTYSEIICQYCQINISVVVLKSELKRPSCPDFTYLSVRKYEGDNNENTTYELARLLFFLCYRNRVRRNTKLLHCIVILVQYYRTEEYHSNFRPCISPLKILNHSF